MLGLTVTQHLVPRLDEEDYGAGELTKLRAQAVSGAACRRVALELGADDRLREVAPGDLGRNVESLLRTERVLASVTEAIIGACFLTFGWAETSAAVEQAFRGEVERALDGPEDFKSALQERVAQNGQLVGYEVVEEQGPPHDKTFRVVALVQDEQVGQGSGRSKKEAEQAAAKQALDDMKRE